jgi:hypothetical protein
MRYVFLVFVGLVCVGFTGCGGGPDNNSVTKVEGYNPANVIKEGLEGVKSSGRIGSSFNAIMSAVRELKAADEAKGSAIEKELSELMEMKDASKIKAKAGEIISKL